MTRIPPDTLARLRAAAEKRRDAEARVAQVQRLRQRRRIEAGHWDRTVRAERERGA